MKIKQQYAQTICRT